MYKSGQSFTLKYLNISFCIQIVIYFIIFNKLGQDKPDLSFSAVAQRSMFSAGKPDFSFSAVTQRSIFSAGKPDFFFQCRRPAIQYSFECSVPWAPLIRVFGIFVYK